MPVPPPPAAANTITRTALEVVTRALRLIGVVAGGEETPIDMAGDALDTLNDMIDAWNAERLAIFTVGSNDFPFILGQQAYTLGSGGNFDMTRPARITGMSAILLSNPANPIEVPIAMYTVEEWQKEMPVKTVSGSFPQVCYDDGGFPFRTLNFWPIPTFQQNSCRIYSWQPLLLAPNFNTNITLPAGYSEAFRFNLAVRLAPEFNAPVSPELQAAATQSLARIKAMNAPLLDLKSDLIATEPGYNYKADLFGIPF